MVKITFLGTGGDAYTVGRAILGAGGIVIEIEGNQFILDPGPGSLMAAKKANIDMRKLVAVLVSHADMNHSNDVNAVLSALSYGGLDRHGVLLASDSVINGVGDAPAVLHPHARTFVERVLSLKDVPRVGINSVNIRVLPAKHTDPTAVGFQLEGEGEHISYTGDTGLTDEVIAAHQGASILIANCSLPEGESKPTHLGILDVITLAKAVKPRLLILTHFSHALVKQGVRSVGRRVSQDVDCHVVVAEDGAVVDSSVYR